MAILKMKRIEIMAMLSDSKTIIDLIQRHGVVEIEDYTEETDSLYKLSTSAAITQFQKFHDVAASALELLNKYAPKKGGLLDSLAPRPELSVSEFLAMSRDTDETLNKCYSINALYKEIQDSKVSIVRANTSIDQLKPWINLDIPSSYKGTQFTSTFVGSINKQYNRETFLSAIAEASPEIDCDCQIISTDKNQTCIIAICHKDDAKEFEQTLRNIGLVAPTDPTKHAPEHRMHRLENEVEECNKKITENEEKIKAFSADREKIEFVIDYFAMRMDKYDALDKISMSDNIFVVTGYIPENSAESLVKKLEEHFDVAVSLTDPDPETEDIPVAVLDDKLGSTMQSVTNMYSCPSQNDIDPNPFMTVFYFLLFGLMLGDAGYGLIMVLICLIAKFKYRLEPGKAKTVNYGLLCGLGTTLWGVLLNGWFGDLPRYIAGGLKNPGGDFITVNHLYWFQPLDHTMEFLLLAFFIGILHLMFGVILNMVKKIKFKHVFEAFVENIPPIMILIGLLPLINSQIGGTALKDNTSTTFIYNFLVNNSHTLYMLLMIGAIGVVIGPVLIAIQQHKPFGKVLGSFGGGLYALYNTASGYLGDILSYSRLLALGLCTGVVASVINQLAAMPGNWIIFIIVEILGHAVNIGINLIGAYVHTNRLQYVEFFSKFYEGGGTPFEPLTVNAKSFKFKEETKS